MLEAQRRVLIFVAATVFAVAGIWLALYARELVPPPGRPGAPFQMSDRIADLQVVTTADGPRFLFGESLLAPDAFARELQNRRPQGRRSWLFASLNITSPTGIVWVAIGLLGQVLFTGRMVLQWIASEKEKRSVIPTAFWWMSLGGATMLITYFIWRVDVVGVLGQATGWFIYLRNLWFIHARSPSD